MSMMVGGPSGFKMNDAPLRNNRETLDLFGGKLEKIDDDLDEDMAEHIDEKVEGLGLDQ